MPVTVHRGKDVKILVMKCGGSIIGELSEDFFGSIKRLKSEGYKIVFVHGGGPDINQMLEQCHIEPEFEKGLRKTTDDVLEIVEMVLSGKSNRCLVHKLQERGIAAVGLNGSDGGMLSGTLIDEPRLGAVGEITKVNPDLIELLLQKDICPVLTPISLTASGKKMNVNADMAAGAIAKSLQAEMCLFVTDVRGVLKDGRLVGSLTGEKAESLVEAGTITGGMIPKVKTALSVLHKGTKEVMIVSGSEPFYEAQQFIGTRFVQEEAVIQ